MSVIERRTFLKSAAAPAVGLALSAPLQGQAPQADRVSLAGDGLSLSPLEYARLLATIAGPDGFVRDTYLHGGPVEALEKRLAAALGKGERGFPANRHAGEPPRGSGAGRRSSPGPGPGREPLLPGWAIAGSCSAG